nr:uncharacterized protein LOC129276192 [Lytechinus pictus]
MPEHHSKFCHHSTLATICDLTPKAKLSLSQVEPPVSFVPPPKIQSTIESTPRDMSSDHSPCCFPVADWLDYTFSVLSMRIGGYKELGDESPQHRTLNIRFHDDDREWVERYLRPVVQEQLPFFNTVTYGDKTLHRDAFVFDHFKDDLEVSFKTVFVVSKSSLDDADFVSMVRQSFHHTNRVKMKKVLLLFIDPPEILALPYGVKYYVDKHMPYLVWQESGRKREYFWKKFVKCTSINKRLVSPLPERCYLHSPWRQ